MKITGSVWLYAVFIHFISYIVPNDGSCTGKALSEASDSCLGSFNVTVLSNPHDRSLVCRAFQTFLACSVKAYRDCDIDPLPIERQNLALQYVADVCGCVGDEIPVCTQNSTEDKLNPDEHDTNCPEYDRRNLYYDVFNSSVLAKPNDKSSVCSAFKTLVYSIVRDMMNCGGTNIPAVKYVADACDCTRKCEPSSTERKFADLRISLLSSFIIFIKLLDNLYY